MKKSIFVLISLLTFLCFFSACAAPFSLVPFVSELRSDIFIGSSENFNVKASYGFKETPFSNDAKVGIKIDQMTFRLLDSETDVSEHLLCLTFNGASYKSAFKFDPVSHTMLATINVDGFNLKEFDVEIRTASTVEKVKMKSIVPEGTIDYKTALDFLAKNQPELINNYRTDGNNFSGEIYVRIVVKNDKSYWYVGLASGNDNLKALLIDGKSGEVLAIREIF